MVTDWGSNQTCLASWMIVTQMSFSVCIRWYRSRCLVGSGRRLAGGQLMKNDFEYFYFHKFLCPRVFDTASYYCPRSPGLKILQHQETWHAALDRSANQLHL